MARRTAYRTGRRGIKKRGVLPSFGDMVLPIVGIAAVVLLIIAGRQFFLNGLKSSPGISSTRAYAEAPSVVAERAEQDKNETSADIDAVIPLSKVAAEIEVSKDPAPAVVEVKPKQEPQSDFLELAVSLPSTTNKQVQTKKPATPKSTSNAAVKKSASTSSTSKAAAVSTAKQWRVQVGAYTSKSGAQEAANKIKKAGYKATVYQNPASKHVKVWVQGGESKQSAQKVVEAMKKLGFKGSFSFPPAK